MFSTVKNSSDWEGQIVIKYENISEYKQIKEEESGDCQEFKIKIEECGVDEVLEDLSQELNGGGHENVDCSDNKCLNSSIRIPGTKDPLECQHSGYNCDDVTNLENHVMVEHNGENECSGHRNIPSFNLVSPMSAITLKSNVNRNRKRIKIYKCEHCGYGSLQMEFLKRHINSIHPNEKKIHKCEYCDYESPLLSNLKKHINNKHTIDNVLKCMYCDYDSPLLASLKRHIKSKHKKKIHKCEYCDYGSPLLADVKIHINSKHKKKIIHKCEYCGYRSTRMADLKSHVNSQHTREEIHRCQYCDYGSPRLSDLKRHINAKHTRENIYKCQYCDYRSLCNTGLKHHINSQHKKIRKFIISFGKG